MQIWVWFLLLFFWKSLNCEKWTSLWWFMGLNQDDIHSLRGILGICVVHWSNCKKGAFVCVHHHGSLVWADLPVPSTWRPITLATVERLPQQLTADVTKPDIHIFTFFYLSPSLTIVHFTCFGCSPLRQNHYHVAARKDTCSFWTYVWDTLKFTLLLKN